MFVLFKPSTDSVRPTHMKKGNLLYSESPESVLISSRNTLTETFRIVFDHIPGRCGAAKWTQKIRCRGNH